PEPGLDKMSERQVVVASPDGRHVYFLGGLDRRTSLITVDRDPHTGRLWREGHPNDCLLRWGSGTECREGPALNNSFALAVSPDNGDVAIGGYAVDQIGLFRQTTKGLRVVSCLGSGTGCTPVRHLARTVDLAFSPDGRYLYAASYGVGATVYYKQ